jgi:hypothetical protein
MRNTFLAVSISCLIMSGVRASRAQDETSPPVARLSVIDGEASLLRGDDATSWVSATVNTPLGTGDSVFAGPDSHAEIQLDQNKVLRLAGQTQISITSLAEDRIQLEVSEGLIDFVIIGEDSRDKSPTLERNSEIDMPNIAARPLAPGVYRIQVESDSLSQITIRKGRLEVFSPDGSTTVDSDTTIVVKGTDSPEYQTAEADTPDDWDRWNEDRNRLAEEISAGPSQDLPDAGRATTGESQSTSPADAQAPEWAPSPGPLGTPDVDESGGAATSPQTEPAQDSRPGWKHFTPPPTGRTWHRRSGAPDQAKRDRSPGPRDDAQPPNADSESPRGIPAPSSADERKFAHKERAAESSRDDSKARAGDDAGRPGSYQPLDERARAQVRPEPPAETARPTPSQVETEAQQARSAPPAPREAPGESANKKN